MLIILGLIVGTIGTLIGAGGGFLLVPILLFMYPDLSHNRIVALSMAAVAFNATSGSIAYFFKKQIHLKAALIFILASLPGAYFGVLAEHQVDRHTFESIFGFILILYSIFLITRKSTLPHHDDFHHKSILSSSVIFKGSAISFIVGFLASFLGIGGGIIHVPVLVHMLGFPVHLAAGTSHLILAVTAWVAVYSHIVQGDIQIFDPEVLMLAAGVVVGAQIGAHYSKKVSAKLILKILAAALFFVGLRLVYNYFKT